MIEPLAGRQLVEDDADGEQVRAAIDALPAALLGRHVADLSLERAGERLHLAVGRLGDAEVDDLHRAVEADDDVLRRDVAVHDLERAALEVALVVRVVEAGAHARQDRHHVLERRLRIAELGARADDLDQVVPAQVLHRDEVLVLDGADVVDLDDVRMVERRGDTRLVEKHAHELRIVGPVAQDLLDDEVLLEALNRLGAR